MAFFPLLLVCYFVLFVAAAVPSNTTIGTFGPLVSFQPVDEWVYPLNQSVPIQLSLGNASLAFDFGFQMMYGISTTDDPETYIQMDSVMVPQYTQLFNFTGNLLANKFWWNVSTAPLDEGSYILTSAASFFACSDGSGNVRTDVFWQNHFTVGVGGTIPANSTGNSLLSGNFSAITAGMYDCTALKDAKTQVSIGLVGTYGAGILFTAIIMTIVRGKNPVQ